MDDNTNQQPVIAQTPSVPSSPEAAPASLSSWPGAFGLYKFSKNVVKFNLNTLIVLILVGIVLSVLIDSLLGDIGQLFSFILSCYLTGAYSIAYLATARGNKISLSESMQKALPFWLKMIGLTIVVSLLLLGSAILLLIPFFFVMPRLVLANYYMVDKNLDIVDSIKASWEATKGHVSKVYGIIGVNILMILLMITIIGIPFSIYFLIMYSAAFPLMYEFLNKQQPAAPQAPVVQPQV